MKKTNLTRSLLAACSIVALSAVMYGCSSSGEDTQRDRAEGAEMTVEQLQAALAAAQAAQAAAEAERDAANAARDAALAAQAAAETERDAANAASAAADAAQATAEAAQAAAEAAQATAEAAQAEAEAAQMMAEEAKADAETAQAVAEAAQAAAEQRAMEARDAEAIAEAAAEAAAVAQATAEAERNAANMAAEAAETAQAMAEAERNAAIMAAEAAAAAQMAAEADKAAAEDAAADAEARATQAESDAADAAQAQMDAEARATQAESDAADAMQAQMDAEGERDAANTARDDALQAQMDAEGERDAANTARDNALQAQMDAEGERDAANTARDNALQAQMDAEGERDAANTARDMALQAQMDAEGDLDAANEALKTALTNLGLPVASSDLSVEAQIAANIRTLEDRITALAAGTADDVLDPIKMAASDAAGEADTAYMAADAAADEAEAADDNRALIQTGEPNSAEDSEEARKQAMAAETAATDAQTASDEAQNAADREAADAARDDAVEARDAAVEAQGKAEDARDEAVADSKLEVKIVGKTKSVGDGDDKVSVYYGGVDGEKNTEIVNEGRTNEQTTVTGWQENITDTGSTDVIVAVADDPGTTDVDETVIGKPAAAERTLKVGAVYDAETDNARLALVTHYVDKEDVGAFQRRTGALTFGSGTISNTLTATRRGVVDDIDHDGDGNPGDGTAARALTLKEADGDYYRYADVSGVDTIAADEDATPLYYFELDDGTEVYVEMDDIDVNDTTGDVTYNYVMVDVVEGVKLPVLSALQHIHFGVWAPLEEAAANGENDIGGLGIGFVAEAPDGGGMTMEMPNHGDATYTGVWTATIQRQDRRGDGSIRLEDGDMTMTVDFEVNDLDVMLMGLATLDGEIDKVLDDEGEDTGDLMSTFRGEDASVVAGDPYGLDSSGTFTGSFEGAFFGDDGEEAGGVFDFKSKDYKEGAFRGSFGSVQDPEDARE